VADGDVTDDADEAAEERDFFISYTRADQGWAEWIAWVLEETGYRVLLQAWDFVPGSNWMIGMQNGIRHAARTLAVLSDSYARSMYGTAEWQAAWKADPTGVRRTLLVARVADCDRPTLLDQVVSFDLFGISQHQARKELLKAAKHAVSGGRAKPTSAPLFPSDSSETSATPPFPAGAAARDLGRAIPASRHGEPDGGETGNTFASGDQPVGVAYHAALAQRFTGPFQSLRQAVIPLDPLPGDLRLADPADLDNPVSRFRGRTELIGRIDAFLSRCVQQRRGGYLLVEAEAGMGKSALATYLAYTRAWPAHFTRLAEGRSPQIARRNLAAQLIACWELKDAAPDGILPEGAESTAWLSGRLSEAAARRDREAPGVPVVLLIDGLDEAPPPPTGELSFGLPPSLPPGTVIIATTRPKMVAVPAEARVVERIDVESAANHRDLLNYLAAVTASDPELSKALRFSGLSVDRFCRMILDRSGGLWIYALTVLDQIRDHARDPTDVARLPSGLAAYYADTVARWRAELGANRWRNHGLPVLATLAAIREPQAAATVALWAANPESDTRDLLRGLFRPFLALRAGGDPDRYIPRHQSLREFCAGTSTHDDEELRHLAYDHASATRAAHARIAAALIPPGTIDTRDWAATDGYTGLHLAEHAALAGVLDELVGDPGFLLTCAPGTLVVHRRDLGTPAGVAAMNAYELALSDSVTHPDDPPSWWLHVWARKTRAHALAEASARRTRRSWTVQTAMWTGTAHRSLVGHGGAVNALAALTLNDGRILLASAGHDATVRLWEPATGRSIYSPLTGHSGTVNALAPVTLPNGRTLLASAGQDATIRLWDPASRQTVGKPLIGHSEWIPALAAVPLPDGRTLLASADGDATVRLWDTVTRQTVGDPLTGHTKSVLALAAVPLPDGRTLLASAGQDATVRLWDPATGRPVGDPLTGHTSWVLALAAVPLSDGRTLLASADGHGAVRLWDLTTGRPVGNLLAGHRGEVTALATMTLADGRTLLASAGQDATVRLWDPATGRPADHPFTGHGSTVNALAAVALADGRTLLASAGDDATLRLWDPASGQHVGSSLTGHTNWIRATATVRRLDGRTLLASGGHDATIRLWDAATGQPACSPFTGHTTPVLALTAVPQSDGRTLLASADRKGMMRLWDPDTCHTAGALIAGHKGAVNALAAVALVDGRILLASAGDDATVRLWDLTSGQPICSPLTGHSNPVLALTAVPQSDGRILLASAGVDETVRLWDAATGRPVGNPLTGHSHWINALTAVTLADGQTLLASAGSDGTVRLWDLATHRAASGPLTGHTGAVLALATMPQSDGAILLASAGADATVRLWDPATGKRAGETLTGHGDWINTLTTMTLADGHTLLASAGDDRTILVWHQADRS
jgi:WD40 repeat protein